MKKNIYSKLFFSLLFISCSAITFSQTVINYQTWTGASGCNIFASSTNVPATINGANSTITHLTAIGQPTYDNVNKSVSIVSETVNNGSLNQGTEYRTTVNFKLGYSYKITINAARIMSSQTGADVLLRLDLNNGGSGSNTLCNGTGIIDANGSGGLKHSLAITSNSFADYVFNYSSLSVAETYLMVAAVPPAASVYQTILIRKITIEESSPLPSFTLASSPTAVACGSITPVTFTATGSNIPNGATVSYNWNLGANNKWKYNGSAAPSTISTGATNTLTLSPICGSALSTVSATATVNGTAYNTNSFAVSITQPSLSITGNSSLCSGSSNYTINGLPCSATIAWTPPPSNLGHLSTLTSSPTTLTYGGTIGSFTLTANVTSCGVSQPVTLPVHVGTYVSSDYTLSWNNGTPPYYCPNQTIAFTLSGGATGSNYNWTWPTGWTLVSSGTTSVILKTPSSQGSTGNVIVNFTEPCGTSVSKSFFVAYSSSACGSSSTPYTISPNPASSTITIACTSLQTYCNIAAVQITDIYGNIKSSQSWNYTNQQVQMPVSFLTNGTYIAKTYDGTTWYSNQFVVQH